jgi:hypothetical protein
MNAAASSLMEAIKYSFNDTDPSSTGTVWDYIPSGTFSWYTFGSGGLNSWGSLCGIPNGCAAVLNLMNKTSYADQVMYYFSQTEFPITGLWNLWNLNHTGWTSVPLPDSEVLAYTTSNSPLCHVSISKWAYAAGVTLTAASSGGIVHKKDRCAKAAAGTAAFTAQLINDFTADLLTPDMTLDCMECHGSGNKPPQQGKMDCWECHTDLRGHK